MKSVTKTSVAVILLVQTALSSVASELPRLNRRDPLFVQQTTWAAPMVVARKVALNSDERARYQQLEKQSRHLAKNEAAGASDTTKIVLIVVAGIVVTAAIAASAHHGNLGPLIKVN